jgi:hypothetical protein
VASILNRVAWPPTQLACMWFYICVNSGGQYPNMNDFPNPAIVCICIARSATTASPPVTRRAPGLVFPPPAAVHAVEHLDAVYILAVLHCRHRHHNRHGMACWQGGSFHMEAAFMSCLFLVPGACRLRRHHAQHPWPEVVRHLVHDPAGYVMVMFCCVPANGVNI